MDRETMIVRHVKEGDPCPASRTHPCLYCVTGRVHLVSVKGTPGLYRWACTRCGRTVGRQWWPTGRGIALIGAPVRISSLDRPNPRWLGTTDGRSSSSSEMAEEYRRDPDWTARERSRFQRERSIFY